MRIATSGSVTYIQSGTSATTGTQGTVLFTDMGNSHENLRIDPNGTVSLNRSNSSTAQLHIYPATNAGNTVTQYHVDTFATAGSSGAEWQFGQGNNTGFIYSSVFGNQVASFNTSGQMRFNPATGDGAYFDYRESTSFNYQVSAIAGTVSGITQTLNHTAWCKIGRQVTISFDISFAYTGASVGATLGVVLPFACNFQATAYPDPLTFNMAINVINPVIGLVLGYNLEFYNSTIVNTFAPYNPQLAGATSQRFACTVTYIN